MINHIRTLILNEVLSDEFIPPDFVPMPETPTATRIRRRLFYGLTQEQKDARMQQIMQLLHMPTLETHVLTADPRVTYLNWHVHTAHPGSLVTIAQQLHSVVTVSDEEILFQDSPELLALWRSDKLLYDLAGILLALAQHTDRTR